MTIYKHAYQEKTQVQPGVERSIAYTDQMMMVQIDFSNGPQDQPDPPHAHPHEQITYVASGELYFYLDGKPTKLEVGDMVTIPPDMPHSIQLLTKQVRLVDCFTPIRVDFLEAKP